MVALENLTEMLKGVLEGCVLEIIGRGETYGHEITRMLNNLEFGDVVEGTVYKILVRLEKNKQVAESIDIQYSKVLKEYHLSNEICSSGIFNM